MKIKIKYEIKDVEGVNKKAYTKTFSQVNEASQSEDYSLFTESYLSLINGNGHEITYTIYKANEEELISGQVQ